jgi:hypothetical protein
VRILGLEVNLLGNRPLLGATKTGFLGLGRRRLQEAAGRQARRLLGGNTWRPTCAFSLLRTPNIVSVALLGVVLSIWRKVHIQGLRPGRRISNSPVHCSRAASPGKADGWHLLAECRRYRPTGYMRYPTLRYY